MQAVTRKVRILDVSYNASNNELVRPLLLLPISPCCLRLCRAQRLPSECACLAPAQTLRAASGGDQAQLGLCVVWRRELAALVEESASVVPSLHRQPRQTSVQRQWQPWQRQIGGMGTEQWGRCWCSRRPLCRPPAPWSLPLAGAHPDAGEERHHPD